MGLARGGATGARGAPAGTSRTLRGSEIARRCSLSPRIHSEPTRGGALTDRCEAVERHNRAVVTIGCRETGAEYPLVCSEVSTEDELARGAALFDAGAYWEAHEAWETVWRKERCAWQQGLIQVAAALYKLVEKKDVEAARRILGRAIAKLDDVGDARAPDGAFVLAVRRCHEALGDEKGEIDRALLPRLGPRTAS
jgi:hypothetical protein